MKNKLTITYKSNPDVEMEELVVQNGKEEITLAYGNHWDDHGGHRLDAITKLLDFLGVGYNLKKNLKAKCDDNGEFK